MYPALVPDRSTVPRTREGAIRPSFLAILAASICLALLCLAANLAASDSVPIPEAASSDTGAVATGAATFDSTALLTLHLEHGVTRRIVHIEPRSDGMAAITAPGGTVDYIPLNKIKRIEDASGADRTSEVVRRGRRLGAQVPNPGDSAWKRFRLRAGPKSVCGSYLITETAMLWRTDAPSRFGGHRGSWLVNLDYGYARNVGDATSLGGTIFVGADEDLVRSGLRLRYVRWLRRDLSLVIAPGIVLLANEEGYSRFKSPGFSSQVGLDFAGRIGLVAQVASVARRVPSASYYLPDTLVRDTDWHVGVRLGGGMGVFGTAVLVGLTILALGSLGSGW